MRVPSPSPAPSLRGPRASATALASGFVGCGGSSNVPLTGDGGAPGNGFPTAPHAPLPVIDDNGGGILAAPRSSPITFEPDALYVGASPGATPTRSSRTCSDVRRHDHPDPLVGQRSRRLLREVGLPRPGDSGRAHHAPRRPRHLVHRVGGRRGGVVPPGVHHGHSSTDGTLPEPEREHPLRLRTRSRATITLNKGRTSCAVPGFGGYHNTLSSSSSKGSPLQIPFAVISVCNAEPTQTGIPQLSVEQTATLSASHEILGKRPTDPYAGKPGKTANDTSMFGYNITSDAFLPWSLVVGGGGGDATTSSASTPTGGPRGATSSHGAGPTRAPRPATTRASPSPRARSTSTSRGLE